ncbi:TolC family outer membrane protein [Coralliovum pocilloporae]|uniref:TolC family outer membrane protein n=1 Tax=Coralliovum pocilloporae TaxID=3066369 RepID=UPI00330705F5
MYIRIVTAALLSSLAWPGTVSAETLPSALAAAYSKNPTLNAARAGVRATDEGVPQALSGYRPTVTLNGDVTATDTNAPGGVGRSQDAGVSLNIIQPIFRGFRTVNATKAAESSVLAAREGLRNTEQTVFLNVATAFMDVVQATTVVGLRDQNIAFLKEQLRAARERLNVGEGTRTDVAQAQARLSAAESQYNLAKSDLITARASYRQFVGHQPRSLRPGLSISRFLPRSLNQAMDQALGGHPAILSALHNRDVAAFNVDTIQGELYPTVTLEGSVSQRYGLDSDTNPDDIRSASIVGRLNVPIYQGGSVYSRVRQAKQQLGQSELEVDVARDQIRAAVLSSWGAFDAARASVIAARSQVRAAQLALEGVIEERKVGQRTTLDVLDAQSELIDAKIALSQAQRDRVVAAFSLLSSVGTLDAGSLNLRVAVYEPEVHYGKVRDKWFGLRVPE